MVVITASFLFIPYLLNWFSDIASSRFSSCRFGKRSRWASDVSESMAYCNCISGWVLDSLKWWRAADILLIKGWPSNSAVICFAQFHRRGQHSRWWKKDHKSWIVSFSAREWSLSHRAWYLWAKKKMRVRIIEAVHLTSICKPGKYNQAEWPGDNVHGVTRHRRGAVARAGRSWLCRKSDRKEITGTEQRSYPQFLEVWEEALWFLLTSCFDRTLFVDFKWYWCVVMGNNEFINSFGRSYFSLLSEGQIIERARVGTPSCVEMKAGYPNPL